MLEPLHLAGMLLGHLLVYAEILDAGPKLLGRPLQLDGHLMIVGPEADGDLDPALQYELEVHPRLLGPICDEVHTADQTHQVLPLLGLHVPLPQLHVHPLLYAVGLLLGEQHAVESVHGLWGIGAAQRGHRLVQLGGRIPYCTDMIAYPAHDH